MQTFINITSCYIQSIHVFKVRFLVFVVGPTNQTSGAQGLVGPGAGSWPRHA